MEQAPPHCRPENRRKFIMNAPATLISVHSLAKSKERGGKEHSTSALRREIVRAVLEGEAIQRSGDSG